jgi:hypothetical protein
MHDGGRRSGDPQTFAGSPQKKKYRALLPSVSAGSPLGLTASTVSAMALRTALLLTLPALVSATKGVVTLDDLTFDKVRSTQDSRATGRRAPRVTAARSEFAPATTTRAPASERVRSDLPLRGADRHGSGPSPRQVRQAIRMCV